MIVIVPDVGVAYGMGNAGLALTNASRSDMDVAEMP